METRAVEVKVTGLVQGVFFRARCAEEAERLGVNGWIRNAHDGSVVAHFEGPAEAVGVLVAWCHNGSPRSSVDRVEVSDTVRQGLSGFDVG